MKISLRPPSVVVFFCLTFFAIFFAEAQMQPSYISAVDKDLSIQRVAVFPMTDNLSGIYAGPLTESLKSRLSMDPRWSLVETGNLSLDFDESSARIQEAMKTLKADAVLTGRVQKGPAGLTLRLTLYVGSSGLPLLVEETVEPRQFSLDRMNVLLKESLQRLRDRLPFHGVVSSRRGQQVTINLGQNSGLRDGDVVDIIQILKINRHPKLSFMISTDKEILGKARIFKADEELSFANLIYEKEAGVVVPQLKVLAPRPIIYPEPISNGGASARSDAPLAFGEKPIEWLPEPTPQYGRAQILGGIGQYSQSSSFRAGGGVSGSNSLTPNLALMAEGWLNRDWWIGFSLRQSAFSVNNGMANSTPGKINMSLSKYDVSAGYNFLLGNDFFGPKLQLSLGMAQFKARADDSSPLLFSNMDFGGTFVGFNFNTDIGEESLWDVGARMKYYLSPSAGDSADSGSVKSVSANDFAFLLARRVRQNFRYVGELNFEYYSTDFDNNGSRNPAVKSNSHRATTLWLGLEYAF